MSEVTPFNLVNPIPKHKLVKILDSNDMDIAGVPLIFDEETPIKVSSKYGQLWQGSSSNLQTLLASKGVPSGQFALQGLQIWNSTDPIKMSFSVNVEMDVDPVNEVLNPIKSIMCKVLPHYGNGASTDNDEQAGFIEKHFHLKLKTLVPPGPNIQTIIQEMTNGTSHATNTFTLKIGCFTIHNMVITSADPKFSKDVCYVNGRPYPISAELSLEMETIEVATTNSINDILS